jgi:microsomal epoxide hydrolase
MGLELRPFTIDVAEDVLDDLRTRLGSTRLPNQVDGIGWDQGSDLDYMEELLAYWRDEFDWRAVEARLRAYDHGVTEVDGQQIHFVHARSPQPDAFPLLVSHGWPGSVLEFLDVLGPLNEAGFHVVAPSLPGYGFSGPTHERGWNARRIAGVFADVMGALGYDRFGAQGGDWGSVISANVADLFPDRVAGLHLNFVVVPRPKGDDVPALTEEEERDVAAMFEWRLDGAGYQEIQGTRPQTLGYALEDSPAGLAAWIVEKFRSWSDCDGDVERSFTKDQLLANITLYWVTRTATSSTRLYWETRTTGRASIPQAYVDVPTGIARYPGEITRSPRSWVERRYNVTHWVDQPRGGHFAAMEVPDLFAADVTKFFRSV